jgi:hypothetical protein
MQLSIANGCPDTTAAHLKPLLSAEHRLIATAKRLQGTDNWKPKTSYEQQRDVSRSVRSHFDGIKGKTQATLKKFVGVLGSAPFNYTVVLVGCASSV